MNLKGGLMLSDHTQLIMAEPVERMITDLLNLDPVLLQLLAFSILLGGTYALVAVGLTMIFGVMDVINFAHGALMVVGMYIVWYISDAFGMSLFISVPLAVVFLFIIGVIMHKITIAPIMDAPQQNQLIVTFGVMLILVNGIEMVFSPNPRSIDVELNSLELFGIYFPAGQLIAAILSLFAIILLWSFLNRTQLGRAIRAASANRNGARYVGINIERIDYLTFGIGAALAGLAGAMIPLFQRFDPHVGEAYLVNAFVIVVLGGLGSFPGAFFGALIIGFVETFGGYYFSGSINQIAIFVMFIIVLLLKPDGLFGKGGEL